MYRAILRHVIVCQVQDKQFRIIRRISILQFLGDLFHSGVGYFAKSQRQILQAKHGYLLNRYSRLESRKLHTFLWVCRANDNFPARSDSCLNSGLARIRYSLTSPRFASLRTHLYYNLVIYGDIRDAIKTPAIFFRAGKVGK